MDEERIQDLIEQFIDDLAAEREPETYAVLANYAVLQAEIEPMLSLINSLRSTVANPRRV